MRGFKNAAGKNAVAVKDEHGNRFDSKAELRRWYQLQLLEKAGVISELRRQVKVPLHGRDGPILTPKGQQMHYVADFAFRENGKLVYNDEKGYPSEVYLMKRAILAAQGIEIMETKT